jgi:hypothetical protein
MATLNSPGVQVQVIDESFYTPSAPGTVPMLFVASAQDKTNPSGSIAQGTTAANAGKVWLITSQRDLTDTFGTPQFYTDASGNAQHGNELNEYGLQSAYSVLGVSSRAYIVRADLDLGQLVPRTDAPEGSPVPGTYWIDTNASAYGIKEWNNTTQKFTVKTPIVINDDNASTALIADVPSDSIGSIGEYAIVLTKENTNRLYFKNNTNTWTPVTEGFNGGKSVRISPHYNYPTYTTSTINGSVWVTTTSPTNGMNWSVKFYNRDTADWAVVSSPVYSTLVEATYTTDRTGGGKNIPVGAVFVETNYDNNAGDAASFKVWRRNAAGATSITSDGSTVLSSEASYTFNIRESITTSTNWSSTSTITVTPTTSTTRLCSLIPAAISAAGLTNIEATYDAVSNKVTISHKNGGEFQLEDGTNSPLADCGFAAYDPTTGAGTVNLYVAPADDTFTFQASNWKPLVYEAKDNPPATAPADGTLWYSSVVDEVDILYHNGTTWVGYKSFFGDTSPAGPIVSATEPDRDTGQSDGSALVVGDIWVSTDNLERYGRDIYVWDGSSWILQDVTDQSTPDGWLFADARWATSGETLEPSDITALLNSNYLDPDAPDPALYPRGMRLWNTRRSGFNVKKYISGHINKNANDGENIRFTDEDMTDYESDRWVSQYPVAQDGGPQFGRLAPRAQVVNAFKELIDSNTAIRDTDTLNFNLLATPGYPEAIQNMIAFNTDRGITAFVLGDTPFRLQPTGTALSEWGNNTAVAFDNGDKGGVSYDEYMAMYYPSGFTNDNTGNNIVVPSSHMMLRTIINSDARSYPWFAPAGTRRGGVDNATSVGFIDGEGEFRPVALHQGLRDVLDDVKINPIATLTGVGIVAYGQRTRARNPSSLDRVNVARLVVYLRRQLDIMARPFLFEPNDAQTRREIKAAAESLLLELVGQRALYDFIVVCDESNNTPARIDRSELYLDIAIEPVKAVEFIYIPLRLKNTGDIAAGL